MAVEAHNGGSESGLVPVPPSYTVCVSQLRAHAKGAVTAAQLKAKCAAVYQDIRAITLKILLGYYWEIGAAQELGVAPSPQEVRSTLAKSIAADTHSQAQFQKFLKTYDESIPDMLFTVQASLAFERVREKIRASIGPVTAARAAAYYAQNKAQFDLKEYRDLWLVQTKKSLAVANQIKRELKAGTSFPTVAQRYLSEQPPYMHGGYLPELAPHAFAEASLNNAIFSAKPGVISGPIRLQLKPGFDHRELSDIQDINGYYLFEIKKISPAHTVSFAQAKAGLMKELPSLLYSRAFATFSTRWESRWRAKTDCLTEVTVSECRQSPRHAR